MKKTWILTPNAQGDNFSYALDFTVFRTLLRYLATFASVLSLKAQGIEIV